MAAFSRKLPTGALSDLPFPLSLFLLPTSSGGGLTTILQPNGKLLCELVAPKNWADYCSGVEKNGTSTQSFPRLFFQIPVPHTDVCVHSTRR
jgi:hypothetical protein